MDCKLPQSSKELSFHSQLMNRHREASKSVYGRIRDREKRGLFLVPDRRNQMPLFLSP